MPSRTFLAVLAAALLLPACNVEAPVSAAQDKGQGPASPAQERGKEPGAPPRRVRITLAATEMVPRTVIATGTLAADDQVLLGTKVAGRLAEITVDLGSRVRKGQRIARLDESDFRLRVDQADAALQQARARLGLPPRGDDDRVDPQRTAIVRQAWAVLEEAKLTRDRSQQLLQQELIARAQFDTAVANLHVAEGRYQDALEEVGNRQAIIAQRRSELELARQQLADTAVVSPIDGAVSLRQASVGEYLGPGAPVATLVRIDPVRLRVPVPEREISGVTVGQEVRLTIDGDRNVYTGRIVRLSPIVAEQNRTLIVEAEVRNPIGALRPGAFARAAIVTGAPEPVVTVPASALFVFAGLEKVVVVRDGKAVQVRVTAGRREGERVQIVEGLRGGEAVILEPGDLSNGQPVTVTR